jgi:hypothetical protein
MQLSRLFAEERGESRTDIMGLTTNIPNGENIGEAVVRQGKRTGGNKSNLWPFSYFT